MIIDEAKTDYREETKKLGDAMYKEAEEGLIDERRHAKTWIHPGKI